MLLLIIALIAAGAGLLEAKLLLVETKNSGDRGLKTGMDYIDYNSIQLAKMAKTGTNNPWYRRPLNLSKCANNCLIDKMLGSNTPTRIRTLTQKKQFPQLKTTKSNRKPLEVSPQTKLPMPHHQQSHLIHPTQLSRQYTQARQHTQSHSQTGKYR